jgi:hypothetical protein
MNARRSCTTLLSVVAALRVSGQRSPPNARITAVPKSWIWGGGGLDHTDPLQRGPQRLVVEVCDVSFRVFPACIGTSVNRWENVTGGTMTYRTGAYLQDV